MNGPTPEQIKAIAIGGLVMVLGNALFWKLDEHKAKRREDLRREYERGRRAERGLW